MLPTPLPSATESNSWRQREIVVCSCLNGPRWIGRNFRVSNRPLMRAALGFSRKFLLLVDTFLLFLHWTGVRLLSSKNVTADLPSRGNAGDLVGDLVANLPFLRRLVSEFFFVGLWRVVALFWPLESSPARHCLCVSYTHAHASLILAVSERLGSSSAAFVPAGSELRKTSNKQGRSRKNGAVLERSRRRPLV